MKIAVGTKNPAKLKGVEITVEKIFGLGHSVIGVDVESGISSQPMSDVESIKGATNRAKLALAKVPEATYGVGLEGGMQQIGEQWFDCGWCVIVNREGEIGVGSSVRMEVPKKIYDLIMTGKELGEVIDIVFGTVNAKRGMGHFGLMTNGVVTRTEGYVHGIASAFGRFLHSDLWI